MTNLTSTTPHPPPPPAGPSNPRGSWRLAFAAATTLMFFGALAIWGVTPATIIAVASATVIVIGGIGRDH